MEKPGILLVEDEHIIALCEKAELEKYNYQVSLVNSGQKAIDYINQNNNIDLVLMDIDLGRGMDGIEAAQIILQNHDIPIFFLSSHTDIKMVTKTEKITSYGYVVKNSGITVLDASIKMAFKLFNAHIQLKNSKENFENIFNGVNDALIFQQLNTGIVLDVNSRMLEMYGYDKKEDVLGKSTEAFTALDDGCTLGKAQFYINEASLGTPQVFEWKAKKKNGSSFWVEVNLKVSKINGIKHIFAVVRDIDYRK